MELDLGAELPPGQGGTLQAGLELVLAAPAPVLDLAQSSECVEEPALRQPVHVVRRSWKSRRELTGCFALKRGAEYRKHSAFRRDNALIHPDATWMLSIWASVTTSCLCTFPTYQPLEHWLQQLVSPSPLSAHTEIRSQGSFASANMLLLMPSGHPWHVFCTVFCRIFSTPKSIKDGAERPPFFCVLE